MLSSLLGSLALVCTVASAGDNQTSGEESEDSVVDVVNDLPKSDYQLYAVRIGRTSQAPRNWFIVDPTMPARIEITYSFWVIRGQNRIVLIDAGFVNEWAIDHFKVEDYFHPLEALKQMGIEASEVTDVIITHNHWDHIGGLKLFKKADIWITKRAFRNIRTGNLEWLRKNLLKAKEDKRLHLISSVTTVLPSVVVVPTGLHTPGFQYVIVKETSGVWVFASDLTPLYANVERHKASGQSPEKLTLAVQEKIMEIVGGDMKRIIPGHEPEVFSKGNLIELNSNASSADQ